MSLVRFTSKAAAEFVMLDVHADPLLRILGKTPGSDGKYRGVVTAADAPDAIARLRAAMTREAKPATVSASADEDDLHGETPVALSQRAWPLIDMLEHANRAHADVLWGV
jgi:hypothetical protein